MNQGQIYGYVKDASGKPKVNQRVAIRKASANADVQFTDTNGRYCTKPLNYDTYNVRCCGTNQGQVTVDRAMVQFNITCS